MSAAATLEPFMSRRPRKPRELLIIDQGTDYGPGHALVRGQLKGWGGAAEVVMEERGDLDNPKAGRTIRGARRWIPVDNLLSRGAITQRHHDAVIKYFEHCSAAEGDSSTGFGGFGSGGVPATSPAERKLMGRTKVRLADAAMGESGMVIFGWAVIGGHRLGDFERRHGMREGAAGIRLRIALTLLDEHYNPKSSR